MQAKYKITHNQFLAIVNRVDLMSTFKANVVTFYW